MRKRVGVFQYRVGLGSAGGDRFEEVEPWVDTGAIYSQFPASLLERLGHRANSTRGFRLADGSSKQMPVGPVPIRIGDEVQPVLCIYGEEEAEMLLGATTLEVFSLIPDTTNKTLTPIMAMLL